MLESTFECRNGHHVTIRIDDEDDFSTAVFDKQGHELGRLVFREDSECLKLTWAYLDLADRSWRRQGIGREILRLVTEISGFQIIASDDDGLKKDDGSHLTGDAPAFVARMRQEGLIRPSDGDQYDRPRLE